MEKDYCFRVISNQVRFGCGYRTVDGKRQYFAWHGYPNRNDDYITTSEISKEEFDEINREYPEEIFANREKAEVSATDTLTGIPCCWKAGVGCCKLAAAADQNQRLRLMCKELGNGNENGTVCA